MRCALQNYSVREPFTVDPRGTLERLAATGLEGIEFWYLMDHDASTVGRWLAELGLVTCAFNLDLDAFETDPLPVFRDAEALSTDTLVVSWLPPSTDSKVTRRYAERLESAATTASAAGFKFGFHLHAEEFDTADDGSVLVERLLAGDSPLFLEIDLGWAWIAGRDLAALLAAAAGRTPIVHLKDFADRADRNTYTSVGEGNVPFLEALRAAEGVEWIVAEQDENFIPDQLSAAVRSCAATLAIRGQLLGAPEP
jgi:sugar phosphate isomerase/epimerase